jgi:hypothetical protein
MRILKIGTFDANGMPTGWHLDMNGGTAKEYCLGIDTLFHGSVDVNGVEVVEWTEARKMACQRPPE